MDSWCGFVGAMLQWYRASYDVNHRPMLCTTNLADHPLDGAQCDVVSQDVCVCAYHRCVFSLALSWQNSLTFFGRFGTGIFLDDIYGKMSCDIIMIMHEVMTSGNITKCQSSERTEMHDVGHAWKEGHFFRIIRPQTSMSPREYIYGECYWTFLLSFQLSNHPVHFFHKSEAHFLATSVG